MASNSGITYVSEFYRDASNKAHLANDSHTHLMLFSLQSASRGSAFTETASVLPSVVRDGGCTAVTDTRSSTGLARDANPTCAAVTTNASPAAAGATPADAATNNRCTVTPNNEKEVMIVRCISTFVIVFFGFFVLKFQISLLLLIFHYYYCNCYYNYNITIIIKIIIISSSSSSP